GEEPLAIAALVRPLGPPAVEDRDREEPDKGDPRGRRVVPFGSALPPGHDEEARGGETKRRVKEEEAVARGEEDVPGRRRGDRHPPPVARRPPPTAARAPDEGQDGEEDGEAGEEHPPPARSAADREQRGGEPGDGAVADEGRETDRRAGGEREWQARVLPL